MNNVVLVGNLVADPEFKDINKDTAVCSFRLVVKSYSDNAIFVDCKAWNALGANINEYCKKGSKVGIIGELDMGSYENKEGEKRYYTQIRVNFCEFLNTKKPDEEEKKKEQKPLSKYSSKRK